MDPGFGRILMWIVVILVLGLVFGGTGHRSAGRHLERKDQSRFGECSHQKPWFRQDECRGKEEE